MRRFTLLLVPLLVITLCVGFIYATEGQRPPGWQTALNDYGGYFGTIASSQRAWNPRAFDSTAFRVVDYGEFGVAPSQFPNTDAAPPTMQPASQVNSPSEFRFMQRDPPVTYHNNVRNQILLTDATRNLMEPVQPLALPATPAKVYCVMQERGEKRHLYFVNYYHDNLWHAGWVIHDGGTAPFAEKAKAVLAELGCE